MATFSVEYFFTSLVTSLHNKLYGIFETLSLVHVYSCLCMCVWMGEKCNYNTEFVFLGKKHKHKVERLGFSLCNIHFLRPRRMQSLILLEKPSFFNSR